MLTVMHYEEGFITYVIGAFSPPARITPKGGRRGRNPSTQKFIYGYAFNFRVWGA